MNTCRTTFFYILYLFITSINLLLQPQTCLIIKHDQNCMSLPCLLLFSEPIKLNVLYATVNLKATLVMKRKMKENKKIKNKNLKLKDTIFTTCDSVAVIIFSL